MIICAGLIGGGSFVGGRYGIVAVNGGVIARIDRITGESQVCLLSNLQACNWAKGNLPIIAGGAQSMEYPVVIPIPSASSAADQPTSNDFGTTKSQQSGTK